MQVNTQAQRVVPWFEVRGDKTLRLNYDLNEESIVFDIGGYEGQWASNIFSKFLCTIHVFEPVRRFAEHIEQRFIKNEKIIVHNFGLLDVTKKTRIYLDDDGSSLYRKNPYSEEIILIRASDFIRRSGIKTIDLMKINIEGGEYKLLEDLITSSMVSNIINIQVQFHDFVPDAERRMEETRKLLGRTHAPTFLYTFVWENWRKIS